MMARHMFGGPLVFDERIAAMSEYDSQRPQDAGNAGETQQQPRVQVESTPAGSNIPTCRLTTHRPASRWAVSRL